VFRRIWPAAGQIEPRALSRRPRFQFAAGGPVERLRHYELLHLGAGNAARARGRRRDRAAARAGAGNDPDRVGRRGAFGASRALRRRGADDSVLLVARGSLTVVSPRHDGGGQRGVALLQGLLLRRSSAQHLLSEGRHAVGTGGELSLGSPAGGTGSAAGGRSGRPLDDRPPARPRGETRGRRRPCPGGDAGDCGGGGHLRGAGRRRGVALLVSGVSVHPVRLREQRLCREHRAGAAPRYASERVRLERRRGRSTRPLRRRRQTRPAIVPPVLS
jgi:hypothetical protein